MMYCFTNDSVYILSSKYIDNAIGTSATIKITKQYKTPSNTMYSPLIFNLVPIEDVSFSFEGVSMLYY